MRVWSVGLKVLAGVLVALALLTGLYFVTRLIASHWAVIMLTGFLLAGVVFATAHMLEFRRRFVRADPDGIHLRLWWRAEAAWRLAAG